MSKHDVYIGFCHAGMVHEPFMQSVISMLMYDVNHNQRIKDVQSVGGSYIAESRNIIVTEFLKTDATWLLFLDNDVVFATESLDLLLEKTNDERKIVAGFYLNYYEGGKLYPTWLMRNSQGQLHTLETFANNQLIEVETVGMGFTVIHRNVFEGVKNYRKSSDDWVWYGHDIGRDGKRMGEDVTFCVRAKAAGFKSFGFTGVQIGHKKSKIVTINDVLPQKPVEK